MEIAYWVGLGGAGIVLFLLLMRLFSSSWSEVGECFIYLFKPQWLSVLLGDFTEDAWKTLKLIIIALMAAFMTFEFHRRAGFQILNSLVAQ